MSPKRPAKWMLLLGALVVLFAIGTAMYFFLSRPIEKVIENRIAELLLDASESVVAWFRQKGILVLPRTTNGNAGELRKVGPIIITRVAGTEVVSWPSHRFGNDDEGAVLYHVTARGADLVKAGVVKFAEGHIHVNAADLPNDASWHVFCLSSEDPRGTSIDEREVFFLQKVRVKSNSPTTTGPVELLVQGAIAQGWTHFLQNHSKDDQLRCFIFMACAQMESLAREARSSLHEGLREKNYLFLLDEIPEAMLSLNSRRQALLKDILASRSNQK